MLDLDWSGNDHLFVCPDSCLIELTDLVADLHLVELVHRLK